MPDLMTLMGSTYRLRIDQSARTLKLMILALRGWVLTVVLVAVSLLGKQYFAVEDSELRSDGAFIQVNYILDLIESDQDIFQMEPLLWIHALRTVIWLCFEFIEQIGGPGLVGAMVLTAVLPIMSLFTGTRRAYFVGSLIPFALLVLSYRGVLVFLSIGYLLLFILRHRSWVYLLVSFVLANLSSGAVLAAILISILIGWHYRRQSLTLKIFIVALLCSLGISLLDKLIGFQAGDSGYDSTVQGATGLVALLSRSTIFVSLISGQYLRAALYILLFLATICGFLYARTQPRYSGYTVLFLIAVPTFMLEGLGVISLVAPTLLFLSGVPLLRKPRSILCPNNIALH